MKDWRNKYQVLFITLLSFWVLISPTYCLLYSLDEVDILRSPQWENPDQEDLLTDGQDLQKELIGSGWNICAFRFHPGKEFLKLLPDLSLNPFSTEKVLVLRC